MWWKQFIKSFGFLGSITMLVAKCFSKQFHLGYIRHYYLLLYYYAQKF